MENGTAELEKIIAKTENGVSDTKRECKDDHYTKEQTPFRRQALICFGTFMLTVGAGATAGFSAVLIPQLQNARGKETYSTEIISWVAAISCLALVFGNLISGYLMERLGRRASQIVLSVTFICGWTVIGFAKEIYLIFIGRFITGLCQGWLGPLGPVFIGETSTPAYRGFFLAVLSLGIAIGVFMSHLFGTYLHWNVASLLCGLFPLVGCIVLYYAPESPTWLASKNRIEESISAFYWYRGTNAAMKAELDKMIEEQTKKEQSKGKLITLKTNIKKPEFWKPLGIMTTMFVITQLTGVNVICAYTPQMMEGLIGKSNKAYNNIIMLSIDVLRCVSLGVACILLRKLGRRPIGIFSGFFTAFSLLILSLYLYLVKIEVIQNLTPVISLGLMVVYMIASNLAIIPLPWNMVGELFATETRGLGSGISVMMTSIAFFGTVKTAPLMFETIGFHGAYLFYGISTLLGTIFLCICLPETKGKTLLQIEQYFRYGSKERTKDVSKDIISSV